MKKCQGFHTRGFDFLSYNPPKAHTEKSPMKRSYSTYFCQFAITFSKNVSAIYLVFVFLPFFLRFLTTFCEIRFPLFCYGLHTHRYS